MRVVSHNVCFLHRWRLMILGSVLLIHSISAAALNYGASIEESQWQVKQSPLECRLIQPIPDLGESTFLHRAGGHSSFILETHNPVLQPGPAKLLVEGPAWKPALQSTSVASIEVSESTIAVELSDAFASEMLDSLRQGLQPAIHTASEEPVKVVLSAAKFQDAYHEYDRCLAQLLPVDFEHIARSAIFFQTNRNTLSESVEKQLALIVRYVQADSRIRRIYVDGHTDDTGPKQLNIKISKARAGAVSEYFKKAGIDQKMLVSRYHADKYPALKNDTPENRARNRRVTVRLERD